MNAEKELKNIRKMLKISKKDFADIICIGEEELNKIENEERKLNDDEIINICNVLFNIVNDILSIKKHDINTLNIESQKRFEVKRDFIVKYISAYIANYQPVEKEINYNDKKVRVLNKINNVDSK